MTQTGCTERIGILGQDIGEMLLAYTAELKRAGIGGKGGGKHGGGV